jgi:HD superfamily phosphodiesterase
MSSLAIESSRLSYEKLSALENFVRESTKHFDSSHNHEHANNVYLSSMEIIQSLSIPYDEDILTFASQLHDVIDHKYPDSITTQELVGFIESQLGIEKSKHVMDIINNVSYSKEVKGLRQTLSEPYATYLIVVSDADKLEALGEEGIRRCETFTLSRGGSVPKDVVQHCHDKLLRLYNNHFIRTDYARLKAKPLHDYILEYVKKHEQIPT